MPAVVGPGADPRDDLVSVTSSWRRGGSSAETMLSGRFGASVAAMGAHAITERVVPLPRPRGDLLVPLAIAAVTQVEVWVPYGVGHLVGPRPLVALVYVLTAAALYWRRRAPLAVLAFVLSVDSALYLAFGAPEGLGTFLPPLIAFYAVGRYASDGSLVLAAPLVALGTAVHELKDPEFALGGSAAFWAILAAAWPIGRAFRTRALAADRLAERALELERNRTELAREAVAQERTRIAREMHDVVGHAVSVLVLQLVAALDLVDAGDSAGARARLVRSEQSARQALAEMRRLLALIDEDDPHGQLDRQPSLRDLERLLEDARSAGAELELTVNGEPRELPAGIDLAAFRVLQEALTNVLKHARPPRAAVRLAYEPDAVVVEVADEGRQLTPARPGGRGLIGMRERVSLYGGEFACGPWSGGGYAVRARLPLGE